MKIADLVPGCIAPCFQYTNSGLHPTKLDILNYLEHLKKSDHIKLTKQQLYVKISKDISNLCFDNLRDEKNILW